MKLELSNTTVKWLLWIVLSLLAAIWLAYTMLSDNTDKTLFMPGPLSAGHHQLAEACDACHIDAFGGGEVLQQACVDCHGKDRVKPFDSHPAKKFKDPRNADLLANINALQCVTCHTEHRPEITAKNGLTQPVDICFYCHQDVAKDRPSHEGMGYETCKDSGCHNFHNNRALYTDYLIKHLHEPPTLPEAVLPAKEFASVLDEVIDYPREKYPVVALSEKDIDASEPLMVDAKIKADWLETAHARSGVNCTACHVYQPRMEAETEAESSSENPAQWTDHPDLAVCTSCHGVEVDRFMQGKHGMRLKQGLSPMTPAQARLPMKSKAAHEQLTCNSCHSGHRFDVLMSKPQPSTPVSVATTTRTAWPTKSRRTIRCGRKRSAVKPKRAAACPVPAAICRASVTMSANGRAASSSTTTRAQTCRPIPRWPAAAASTVTASASPWMRWPTKP